MVGKGFKDPELKGIYVKRCKCGSRPYYDRICTSPEIHFIACNCGHITVGSSDGKQEAVNNWNNNVVNYD